MCFERSPKKRKKKAMVNIIEKENKKTHKFQKIILIPTRCQAISANNASSNKNKTNKEEHHKHSSNYVRWQLLHQNLLKIVLSNNMR